MGEIEFKVKVSGCWEPTEDQLEGLRLELISRPTIKRTHDSAAQTYCCRYASAVCAQGWHFPHTSLTRKGKKILLLVWLPVTELMKVRILSFWV